MYYNSLPAFRDGFYLCFARAKNALMDTADALLSEPSARSLPELSLSPFFGRTWHSLYEAFADAKINRSQLQRLFAAFAPTPEPGQRLLLGVDASSILRPLSHTVKDRTWVHASNLPSGLKPVGAGWQFSSLCVLPSSPSSWTYVLDNQRIQSTATAPEVAARQLHSVVPCLSQREGEARPLLLADGGYGNVAFLLKTQGIACDKLLRFAKNRVLYRPTPPRPQKPGRGAPRKDGAVFRCADPTTHGTPDAVWKSETSDTTPVEVACWHDLHFKAARLVSVTVVRVTREGATGSRRTPRVVWFVFEGETLPPLSQLPSLYGCRYSLEHGFRVDKQDLMWERVRLRSPEAFESWTNVVAGVRNQLFLAKDLPLTRRPWESKDRTGTPAQVRRGMGAILRELRTPSPPAQRRGNSPGRTKTAAKFRATRYEVVCKHKNETENPTDLV